MKVDPGDLTVIHNTSENRFEIQLESHLAQLKYRMQDGTITFTHTGVPPALEGQGVGGRLVRAGLEYAREHSLKVKALCSFVATFLKRHPEYQDLT
jgi:predicted GNAT family acetyltransferase